MKLLKLYVKYVEYLMNLFYEKHWLKLFLHIFGICIGVFCVSMVLSVAYTFIMDNFNKIATLIGSGILLISLLLYIFPKKEPILEPPNEVLNHDPNILENTYEMVRNHVCTVLNEVGDVVKLRKPATLSQLDAPNHHDIIGNTPIYHYLALKQTNEFDIFNTTGIIQNRINQKLNNQELDGITQTSIFYNGASYPTLMVDNIRDLGQWVQIDMALSTPLYIQHRQRRIYNTLEQNKQLTPRDKDF